MKLGVFSVFDDKAAVYTQPFYFPVKGQAIRMFSDAAEDDKFPFKKHPEDYSLYQLGEFDDVSGKLTALPEPLFIIRATDFLNGSLNNGR